MFWEHLQWPHRTPAVGVAPVLLQGALRILKLIGQEQEIRDEIREGTISLIHVFCPHLTHEHYVNEHLARYWKHKIVHVQKMIEQCEKAETKLFTGYFRNTEKEENLTQPGWYLGKTFFRRCYFS